MSRRSRWLAVLAGTGLVLAITTSVFAYVSQVPTTITVTPSSGTLRCDHFYVVRATVLDQNGKPIKGLTVTWSFTSSPSSHDQIKTVTSKTNGHGVAQVLVRLACVPGDRVITATTDGISGSAVLQVELRQHGGQGAGAVLGITSLPRTSTMPADTPTDGLPTPAIPAVVAFLVAVAIIVRRFAFTRR